MPTVKYRLRIQGLSTPAGKIPVRALLDFLHQVTECAERGLRLAVDGASVKTGRPPAWLEQATDFTFAGVTKGSTVLEIEAPTLGTVLGDQARQTDFWVKPPELDETAVSYVTKSIRDATAENLESDYYDGGVLKSLMAFKPFLKGRANEVQIQSAKRPQENVRLNLATLEKAERLKVRTSEPQALLISGLLNRIEHSERRFQLVLSDGQAVPGRVDEEFISAEGMREYWGKKVTVRGTVFFRPSGRVQMIAAQQFKPMEAGEEIFEYIPRVQTVAEFVQETAKSADGRNWLQNVWGQWPGDEPIDDILRDLKR